MRVLLIEFSLWGITTLLLVPPDNLFDEVLLFGSEDLYLELIDSERRSDADRFLEEYLSLTFEAFLISFVPRC